MKIIGGCTCAGVLLIIFISVTAYSKLKSKNHESDSPCVEVENNSFPSANTPAPSYAVSPAASKYIQHNNDRNDQLELKKTGQETNEKPLYPLNPLSDAQSVPSETSKSEFPDIPPPPYSNSPENTVSPPIDMSGS